jgi:hypothetical protein
MVKGKKQLVQVDKSGAQFTFCPGKAQWYPLADHIFRQCKDAYYTGYLPEPGAYLDQSELFCESYAVFCERFKEREYNRTWSDVGKFAPEVIKALSDIILAPWK